MADKLSATILKDINDVPEGFETRDALSKKLSVDIPPHKMSYAATHGLLGDIYYAVGQVGYYNAKEATLRWGNPQARGAITRNENGGAKKTPKKAAKKAPKKAAKKATSSKAQPRRRQQENTPPATPPVRTAPDPIVNGPSDDSIVMLTLEEAALVSGRTVDEVREMLSAGTFIDKIGVNGAGAPMWVKKHVVAWTAMYPPEPVSMVFDGASVRVSRHILPGVYTLTRTDLSKSPPAPAPAPETSSG